MKISVLRGEVVTNLPFLAVIAWGLLGSATVRWWRVGMGIRGVAVVVGE